MMTSHNSSWLRSLLLATLGLVALALPVFARAEKPKPDQPAITIKMEDCKATRPGRITGETVTLATLLAGPPREDLVKRGTVDVDGQKYNLYLPKAKSYAIKNTKPSDWVYENTSTAISVDQKGDGKLTEDENWFANLPLRIGDRMFDVAEIAADGSRIVLKPSRTPLSGIIVGRRCPGFSFTTAEGKPITRDGLAGKVFLLDIWSVT